MADGDCYSVVEYFPGSDESGHRCGYCRNESGSVSQGMWAHRLSVDDFQELTNRNWRRSGKYLYKPAMDKTCCPLYMVQCAADRFTASKHQKKTIKRVNKFLNTGLSDTTQPGEQGQTISTSKQEEITTKVNQESSKEKGSKGGNTAQGRTNPTLNTRPASGDDGCVQNESSGLGDQSGSVTGKVSEGSVSSAKSPGMKKAKTLRYERKKEKLVQLGRLKVGEDIPKPTKPNSTEKTFKDLLGEYPCSDRKPAHQLELVMVRSHPPSVRFQQTVGEEHEVYRNYQEAIHGDKPEDCSLKQFTRFLVDSPLCAEEKSGVEMGSFHCQYVLDGKIVAVEVMDVLPECLSSVYFFYDPNYKHLDLGTYSAIRSVEMILKYRELKPSLCHYLMGFFLPDCIKMKYKAAIRPSYLLCPETYQWTPMEISLPKIQESKYSRLTNDIDAVDENCLSKPDSVSCLYRGAAINYAQLKLRKQSRQSRRATSNSEDDAKDVTEYAGLVGKVAAKRMFLYRADK